jgi:mannose-6-phosphate isomerase-like protein (cupin superfamily)
VNPTPSRLFFGFDEGEVIRVGPPSTGQIIIKVDRRSTGSNRFLMALEVLEPGGHVPTHYHETQEELVFVYSGRGKAVIGDEEVEMVPGTTLYLPPKLWHGITHGIGTEPLCLALTYCPPGMEDFFRELGKLSSVEANAGVALPLPHDREALAHFAERYGIRFRPS